MQHQTTCLPVLMNQMLCWVFHPFTNIIIISVQAVASYILAYMPIMKATVVRSTEAHNVCTILLQVDMRSCYESDLYCMMNSEMNALRTVQH
mmetsp:Transcript_43228/g.113547  ORF Transcript_43228/g.113547 Transcript_43228/m.113547 type:complete len:92 (-) Transcript_43228:990-1265(-)